ncbi:MAG: MCE family protein [Phycisphaeraceae bacterium]|nr:MCE family protein [Phycisphaeraceae bacterium]
MSERTRNIIVGLTVILGLSGVGMLMLLFGFIPHILTPGYNVRVQISQATGLNTSSRVKLDGVDIGQISRIELQKHPARGVMLTLVIDRNIQLSQQASCTVESPLLGGGAVIAFSTLGLSDEQMADWASTDGSAMYAGKRSSPIAGVAQNLQSTMEQAVAGFRQDLKRPIDSFVKLEEDFHQLQKAWEQVGHNIAALTEPRQSADVDAGKAPGNLATIMQRADARLGEIQKTIQQINDLVGDEQLRGDIKQSAANVSKLSGKFVEVADNLSVTIESLRKTSDQAREGQGSLGKLIKDPALYDNLNDAVLRIGQAADEIKLLIEKWKAEGVSVKF